MARVDETTSHALATNPHLQPSTTYLESPLSLLIIKRVTQTTTVQSQLYRQATQNRTKAGN